MTAGFSRGTLRTSLAILAVFALATLPSQAEQPGGGGPEGKPAVPAKQEPPSGGPPRPLKLPKIHQTSLPSGLKVRIVEDHRFPLITALVALPIGTSSNPRDLPGLAEATTELLREGTTRMTSRQIADELASIGGELSVEAGADTIAVRIAALSEFTPRALALLADVVTTPSFPESEVALRRENAKQELALNRSQPAWLAQERFSREVYGPHPYAIISPTGESIERLDRTKIAAFHRSSFSPVGAVLVIVGDVTTDAAMKVVTSSLGKWKAAGGDRTKESFPSPPSRSIRQIYLVDRPGSVQTDLRVGGLGIRRNDAKYFASIVMDQILGGGAASRLFMTVREEKGLAYDAHSELTAHRTAGDWAAVTQVRTEVTKAALEEILKQMDRVRTESVSESELQYARNYLNGIFTLRLERSSILAGQLANQILYDLPADYLETYVSKVSAVKAGEVLSAAKALCDGSRAAIVAVGDAQKIKADLAGFGPVTVYTAEGKPEGPETPSDP